MHVVEPEPWASGLRFNEEPEGLHHHTVGRGSPADGSTIEDLDLGEDGWISMVNREGRLLQVRGGTRLQAGDIVLTLADPDAQLDRIFDASVDPG
jgi:cell volume regulation protein A